MISVVLPSRNETMLEETCVSMFAGGADEIIVIDDGSNPPVMLQMDKVKVHRLDDAKGPSHCRNLGGALSTGDIVIYSDAHVLVPPDGLKKLAALAEEKDTVVCAAVQPLGGRNWVGYGGVVVDIGGGYDVKYNRKKDQTSPTGFIGSVYGATRKVWDDIGWWPTTLSWGYNEQALSLAVLYAGKRPFVAVDVVCLHQFKKRFNYPVQQSTTRINRLLVHYQCCENFESHWLPLFKQQFRGESYQFSQLFSKHKDDWEKLREFRKGKRKISDQQVTDIITGFNQENTSRASRVMDTGPDSATSVNGTVVLFTPFAPGREAALPRWVRQVESAGYPLESRVFVIDSARTDVENYARECQAVVYTRPKLESGESIDIANHLAGHWNEVLPELLKSDFILSVEDDVFPEIGYLEKLIRTMVKNPDVGVVGAAVKSRHGGHTMAYNCPSIDPFEISREPLAFTEGVHAINSVSFSCTLIRTKAIDEKFQLTGQPNVVDGQPSGNKGHEFCLMKHVQLRGWKVAVDYDIKTEHKIVLATDPEDAPAKQTQFGKENFIKTKHCSARVHCKACRESQTWRDAVKQQYWVPDDWDFRCPNGLKGGDRTMPEMAMTLATAVGRAANAALKGQQVLASHHEVVRRWRACQACGSWYIPDTKRCKQCGCFLEAKIALATERCPLGRWHVEVGEATAASRPAKRPCGGCRKSHQAV